MAVFSKDVSPFEDLTEMIQTIESSASLTEAAKKLGMSKQLLDYRIKAKGYRIIYSKKLKVIKEISNE